MRITCPSCKAVYEAPDEAIGAGGRVVECSDCGARWMQPGPASSSAAPEDRGGEGETSRMPGLSAAAQAMSALRGPAAAAEPGPGAAERLEVTRPIPAPPPPSRPQAPIAPAATPAAAGPGPEAAPRRREVASIDARDLMAQLREAEAEAEPPRRAGRAAGFVLALLISAGAAGAYLERERIAEAAPQAAPYLDRYAGAVDQARRAVDGAAAQVRGMIGG